MQIREIKDKKELLKLLENSLTFCNDAYLMYEDFQKKASAIYSELKQQQGKILVIISQLANLGEDYQYSEIKLSDQLTMCIDYDDEDDPECGISYKRNDSILELDKLREKLSMRLPEPPKEFHYD